MRNIFTLVVFLLFSFSIAAQAQMISTIAGDSLTGYNGDNIAATAAELSEPIGIAVDASSNLYICDRFNNRLRKVNSSGIITTIAGTGTAGYNGDNGPATDAEIKDPYGIALDASGNVYFSDNGNNRIRKISATGIITTVAGNGTRGYNEDGIPATAAELSDPSGLAFDAGGNLYVADFSNYRIRKIDTAGIISTIAGTGTAGYNGENIAATSAELSNPSGLAIDAIGNIYIVDYSNSRIRKVNTSGFIATIAGNGTGGYSGDNFAATSAELRPLGIAVDGSGNVYIGDANNDAVRKINSSGIITTIAGTGVGGFSGDGGPANMAQLHGPVGVAIDNEGSMYIGDAANNRIRYIRSTVFVNQISGITDAMHVYPNPSSGIFTINIVSGNEANVRLCITNVTGEKVKEIMAVTNTPVDVKLDVPDGIYFLTAITTQGLLNQKIVLRAESP